MKKVFTHLLIIISLHVSAQNNIVWNMGMNIATSASGNEHPRIAVDRSGNPMVIWHHVSRCMFSRWNGTAFTTPVLLNPASISIAGANWMGPDIASHGDTVYVVFKQTPEASDTCHIFCVHSYNGGMTFSAPVRVDNINDSISRFPTVTTDDLGNPIIGFMKFDPAFGNARWVVATSADFGNSFSIDVKASGWSSMTSTVCDCCPGSLACSGNNVAMMYRDNDSNIRDTWAGLSTNGGNSFYGGMGIDQQGWLIMACPSTGPDGVIIGDTLYSAFMNGASGMSTVYFSKSSISAATGSPGLPITGTISGLTLQNYPRVAASGGALAVVWKQVVNGTDECALRFTTNIATGLPAAYDTVDLNDITNADVSLTDGNIFVVWEDDASGTVKYRSGTFTPLNTSLNELSQNNFSVYPNPSKQNFNVELPGENFSLLIRDVTGRAVYEQVNIISNTKIDCKDFLNGIYFINVTTAKQSSINKKIVIVH